MRRRYILEGEVVMQGHRIDIPTDRGMAKQRFGFGTEDEPVRMLGIVKRFDTDPVPCEHQSLSASVPKCDGVHAIQHIDEIVAHLLVEMDDDIAIGMMAAQPVAARCQIGAKTLMVVDFAVEHGDDLAILVQIWLMAAGKVDNRQAPHAEMHRPIIMAAFVVGTAMTQRGEHRPESSIPAPKIEISGDPAHRAPYASSSDPKNPPISNASVGSAAFAKSRLRLKRSAA